MALSILIVDDQSLFREGLDLVLQKVYPDARCKQAGGGPEALEMIEHEVFNLVFLDIAMPGMNGIEVAQRILTQHPAVKILVLTQYSGEALVHHLVQMGVHGFLLKDSKADEIKEAIETILGGESYLDSRINRSVKKISTKKAPAVVFNQREAAILLHLKMGKSSKEIAQLLSLKENTINSYREDMLQKTKTHNVAELISYAYENGVLS
jgi:DNA-binding NarL/FixJ family response regulator